MGGEGVEAPGRVKDRLSHRSKKFSTYKRLKLFVYLFYCVEAAAEAALLLLISSNL